MMSAVTDWILIASPPFRLLDQFCHGRTENESEKAGRLDLEPCPPSDGVERFAKRGPHLTLCMPGHGRLGI